MMYVNSTTTSKGTEIAASFSTDRYPKIVTAVSSTPATTHSTHRSPDTCAIDRSVYWMERPKISVLTANQQNMSRAMMAEINLAPASPKVRFRIMAVEMRVQEPTWAAATQRVGE